MLAFKIFERGLVEAVVKEFIARGLDKTYAKEIEAWKKYKREQKFAIKLDKQMQDELKRFKKTIKKWKPKELEEFVIEYVN